MAINYVNLEGVSTGSAWIDNADVLYINPLDAKVQAGSNSHLTTLDPSGAPLEPEQVVAESNTWAWDMPLGIEQSGTSQAGSGGQATKISLNRNLTASSSAIAAAQVLVMQRRRGINATATGTTTITAALGVKKALGGTATGTSRIEGDTLFWKDQYNQEVYLEVVGSPTFNGDGNDAAGSPGTWSVPVALRRGAGGPGGSLTGCRIAPGTAAVKWGSTTVKSGESFTGGLTLTSDMTNAPYMDVFTVDRAGGTGDKPWDDAALKSRVRLGNLAGVLGNSNIRWGIAMSTDLSSSSSPYIESSNSGLTISNANVTIKNGTFYAGAADRSKYIEWDGVNLTIHGDSGSTQIDGSNIITGTITLDKLAAGDSLSIATNALLYLGFDGPAPFNTNFTGSAVGNFGQDPNISGSLVYRQGKFGKAGEFAEATTNLVVNPSFEWGSSNGMQGWTAVDNGGGDASKQVGSLPTDALFGTYALQISKTSATGQGTYAQSNAIALAVNTTYTLSGYIRCTKASTSAAQLYITAYTGSFQNATAYYATNNFPLTATSTWQRFSVTFTTSSVQNLGTIYCMSFGQNSVVQFDGIQLEQKAYCTPYNDGSLGNGHTWTGTAHNSTSSRTASTLTYLQSGNIKVTKGSVAAWVYLDAAGTFSGNRYLMNLAATTGAIRLGVDTTGHAIAYWGVGQVTGSNILNPFTWYHLAMTYDGSTLKLYVNGSQVGSLATADFVADATNLIEVGNMSGSNQLNGLIEDFVITDTPFTAAQLLAIYTSSRPLQVPKGNFDLMLSGGTSGGWIQGNGDGLTGYSADGTAQAWFGTDGKLYAGGSNVILDANGISIVGGSFDSNALTWYGDNTLSYEMAKMWISTINPGIAQFNLSTEGGTRLTLAATKSSITSSYINLYGTTVAYTGGIDVGNQLAGGSPGDGKIIANDFLTPYSQSLKTCGIAVVIDGGGQLPPTSSRAYFRVPYSMRTTNIEIVGNGTGSCTLQVYKCTYSTFGTWTSLGTVSIASANKNTYSTGTGWDFSAGDYIAVNVNSVTTFTLINVNFIGYKY